VAVKCVNGTLRSVTSHMGSHNVTFHPTQVNTPRHNSSQTGQYPINLLWGMEGWVDLCGLLHTQMAYKPADGYPSYLLCRCKIPHVSKFTSASRGYPSHSTAFLYEKSMHTEWERDHSISVDDVVRLVEEAFRTELLWLLPIFRIHVCTVQVD